MDADEFRRRGKEMVDYVADYMEGIRHYPPQPQVRPGFLRDSLPDQAPSNPESFEELMRDVNNLIVPGMTHWQSPHFHAYFPIGSSYAATLAEILSETMGCVTFSWTASPAGTELEMTVMDWLVRMLDLPGDFLFGGKGGGVLKSSASESTLLTLLAARSRAIKAEMTKHRKLSESDVIGRLVVYCSDQAHSSVERACMFGAVRCHKVETDNDDQMRGNKLREAICADREKGLIPFYVVATLGTTASCSFDQLHEIGPICEEMTAWLHIDAAYAGSAFACPEFRYLLAGVQFADSFNFNPHKLMLVPYDCSALWLKDSTHLVQDYTINPAYLRQKQDSDIPEYRNWEIALGRRFKALKLWFVLRLYGVTGIQKHIRKHVALGKRFEEMVRADDRFTVPHKVIMGLVCFRLKGKSNEMNAQLLQDINNDGRIRLIPSESKAVYFIRFVICTPETQESDVEYAWKVIREVATTLLAKTGACGSDACSNDVCARESKMASLCSSAMAAIASDFENGVA